MSKKVTDGLARLQNQSRIPASKWREWCTLLGLDPIDAVETWEEICYPIMVATRSMPVQEISYILQMRTARPELDVFDFKEKVPKVLHAITFLYHLNDERLTKGKVRSSILKFYKRRSSDFPVDQLPTAFVQRFIIELCSIVLIAKTLRGPNITLSGALKPVIEGQGTFAQLLGLATKSLSGAEFDDMVRDCLTAVNPDQNASPIREGNGSVHATSESDAEQDDLDDDEDVTDDHDDASVDLDDASEDLGDDDEDLGDDDDLDDDDDLNYDDDEDPVSVYLTKFKAALKAIYEVEAESGNAPANSETVLDGRFRSIAAFNPMSAVVPAMEEAQAIARRLEAARNPNKPRKANVSITAAGGGGIPSGPVSSAGAAIIAKGAQISDTRRKTTKSARVSSSTSSKRDGGGEGAGDTDEIEVESRDVVDLTPVSKGEFSDKVREIGAALGAIAPADQIVWGVFLEPGTKIGNLRTFARTLSKEGSGQYVAYNALKKIGMLLPVKETLAVADKGVIKSRNFTVEVTTFMNTMKNSARELAPDNRQLAPVVKILDNASAALLRLEAIRVNQVFSEEHPDQYDKQAVMVYYEESLRALTDLTDREILGNARSQADADTVAMLETFAAKQYADRVVEACKTYVQKMKEDGNTKSAGAATTAIAQDQISFDEAEPNPEAGPVPAELLASSGLGDTFDVVAKFVLTHAWAVLRAVHEPQVVAERIQEVLRQILVSTFEFQPEKKRHQENPRLAINVVSLDKICGKQGFVNLCVRVGDDGKSCTSMATRTGVTWTCSS